MKKINLFLSTLALLFTLNTSAQDSKHEVKICGAKLLAFPILDLSYEYIQNEDFTYGANMLWYPKENKENYYKFSLTPYARFYFQESKEYGANGFYVEGFAGLFNGESKETNPQNETFYDKYNSTAAGLGLGKKWFNNSGFVLDINVGIGRTLFGSDDAPSAVFKGGIYLGYRF